MSEQSLRERLGRDPSDIQVRLALAHHLVELHRSSEAAELLRHGLERAPDDWQLLYAYGESLLDLDRVDDGVQAFRRALQAQPDEPNVMASLGGALLRLQEFQPAAELLARAAEQLPNDVVVWELYGEALAGAGRSDEASRAFQRACRLGLRNPAVTFYVANQLSHDGAFATAVAWFDEGSRQANDDSLVPWHNFGKAAFELGDLRSARRSFSKSWERGFADSLKEIAVIIPGDPESTPSDIRYYREAYAKEFRLHVPPWQPPGVTRDDSRPIRVGYLSSFFANPNYMKPVYAVLREHDRRRVQVELLHDGPPSHELAAAVDETAVEFVFDVSELSNRELVAAIRQRDLDVLVDLNGYSAMWRLPVMSARLARRVVGWFNYYATSGMAEMDMLVADAQTYDDRDSDAFCEQVVCIPRSYLAFRVDHPCPAVVAPPCVTNGFVTFGSLCSQYKLTNATLDGWAAILRGVHRSRLVLANRALEAPDVAEYMRCAFESRDVSRDRIELRGGADHLTYLTNYDDIDVALDAWPYNGGTTTTEAMWQGVPVACFRGDRWASRTSASLVCDSPFREFLFGSADEMVTQLVARAMESGFVERLRELRFAARDELVKSAVCDVRGLASALEDVYRMSLGMPKA